MPDLSAGTIVKGEDTPPAATDTQNDSFTFNSTTYGTDNDSGTYLDCGVAFKAPTSGREKIDYTARLANDTANQGTLIAPVVRLGGTVGAGTIVRAASDNDALQYNTHASTGAVRFGSSILLVGLTPGTTYNVRLEHRVGGGIGTLSRRNVIAIPVP